MEGFGQTETTLSIANVVGGRGGRGGRGNNRGRGGIGSKKFSKPKTTSASSF